MTLPHMAVRALIVVVVALICLGESQITFSRAWVRGKLPGEERVIRVATGGRGRSGENDDIPQTSAFLRDPKAELDFRKNSAYPSFPREGNRALLYNLRRKFVLDFLQRARYPPATRFKERDMPSSSESMK